MTTAIKHYWKNVKKANDIINPGSTKVPMQVRHFYGELPSDWTANTLLNARRQIGARLIS